MNNNPQVKFRRIRGRIVPIREKIKEGLATVGSVAAAGVGSTLAVLGADEITTGVHGASSKGLKSAFEKVNGGARGATVFARKAKLFAGKAIGGYRMVGAGLMLSGLSLPLAYYASGKMQRRLGQEDKRKPFAVAGLTVGIAGTGAAFYKYAKPIAGNRILRTMIKNGIAK